MRKHCDAVCRDIVSREYPDTQSLQLEQRTSIRLGTMTVAATGVTATLVKLL